MKMARIPRMVVKEVKWYIMSFQGLFWMVLFLIFFLEPPVQAAEVEIKGKVVSYKGSRVKIEYKSELVPRWGDEVKIGFEISGEGFIPVKGRWNVVEVSEDFLWAEPGEVAVGKIGIDYLAIIFLDSPRTKSQFKLDQELLEASKKGNLEQARKVIKAGADVNTKGNNGETPLLLAAGQVTVNMDMIKTLIEAGADIKYEAPRGQTALHKAAFLRHNALVRTLIDAGVDVDARIKSRKASEDFQGATPLLMAVRGAANTPGITAPKEIDTVRALIDAGGDGNISNKRGITPLMAAALNGKVEIILILLDAGADMDSKTTAVEAGPPAGITALMAAAHEGHLKAVQTITLANADIGAKNSNGQTALMFAKQNGHSEVVEYLKKPESAKQVAKQALGKELIHAVKAVKKEKMEYARLLIRFGVDVNVRDKDGRTALIEAIENGSGKNVRALVNAGADVNAPDRRIGATPLIWAARNGNNDIIETLIQSGAEVNRKARGDSKGDDGAGWTALMAAAMAGHTDVVSQLLKAGADPNSISKAGKTAMDFAKKEGNKEVVRLLEEATKSENLKKQ